MHFKKMRGSWRVPSGISALEDENTFMPARKRQNAPNGCYSLENKLMKRPMKTKILQKTFLTLTAGFAALLTLLVSASTAFSLTFTTIDPPGSTATLALDINARGDIVGNYLTADGKTHGFLLSNGTFTTIDVPRSRPPQ